MTRRARICLIDDDVMVLDATALGLRDAGFEVFTASNVAAGLDILRLGGIDAIVTDLNMPGVNGAHLISEARAVWPDLPIIAISGQKPATEASANDRVSSLGADAVLYKPFRAEALKTALHRAFAARQPS